MPDLAKRINQKLTLGKLKRKNMVGQKCTKCGWRKIASEFSDKCPKCYVKVGI